VGFGVGFGVGEGVGVGDFVGFGVGVDGQWADLQYGVITDDAAKTGIIPATTKNRPVRSIHKAINAIIIMAPLL
jgi:hypothetical protein